MSTHQQHLASDSITAEIAQAVATERGIDPTELEPPLYTAVDTEALDEVFSSTNHGSRCGTVTFTYCGQRVTVRSDDGVEVDIERADGRERGTGTDGETERADGRERNAGDRR